MASKRRCKINLLSLSFVSKIISKSLVIFYTSEKKIIKGTEILHFIYNSNSSNVQQSSSINLNQLDKGKSFNESPDPDP